MRCQRWPDDRCRSPTACEGFGYCRERNFDFKGHEVNPNPFAEQWRRLDDDGMRPGYSYETAHKPKA
jgi:hypothetical protein